MMTNAMALMQQFMQFKNNFKGNPQEQIQQMLNSGKITQEQYNNAFYLCRAGKPIHNKGTLQKARRNDGRRRIRGDIALLLYLY